MKKQAEIDRLTGLYNKYTYKGKCSELIKEQPNTFGAFFFVDLNDFKQINDTYGHIVGDKALIHFSNVLKEINNKDTIFFRIAGDEFGIFRMGLRNHDEITDTLQEIKKCLQCEIVLEGRTIPIKSSVGGSIYNLDATDLDTLIHYADFAMYQAKEKEDEYVSLELFDKGVYSSQKEKVSKGDVVDTIIKEKRIYPVYQPICCIDEGEVHGYEGLSRTNHPAFANIMELIETAEGENRLDELDLLMMEQSIRGFKGEGKLSINIENKSPKAIEKYMEKMIQVAKEVRISVQNLTLELPERKKWTKDQLEVIKKYRENYQLQLALDDFGIDFSNVSMILELQPNIIKIDRSSVSGIHQNEQKYFLVKAFCEFAKNTNIAILCEGIEEKAELDILKKLGCDYGQGYYLGKPTAFHM